MFVNQTTIISFGWDEYDPTYGAKLLQEGFKQEICTAGISFSKTSLTAWKVGKEGDA